MSRKKKVIINIWIDFAATSIRSTRHFRGNFWLLKTQIQRYNIQLNGSSYWKISIDYDIRSFNRWSIFYCAENLSLRKCNFHKIAFFEYSRFPVKNFSGTLDDGLWQIHYLNLISVFALFELILIWAIGGYRKILMMGNQPTVMSNEEAFSARLFTREILCPKETTRKENYLPQNVNKF